MRVTCLLPARNAAADLPRWFESVARFADDVVALDDGSSDATAELLDAHPMVKILLRNPARADYEAWNDSFNRNLLLGAACALEPDWIVSVDADELVPPDDAVALRRFIAEQAAPGVAYGFPRYRMIDDDEHHDGREDRVYRLFAYDSTQVFPSDRLHFMPVPTSILPTRWLTTDLRFQHFAGLTAEHRRLRRQKYRQADPNHEWEHDYSYIEAAPAEIKQWPRRHPETPVVLEPYRIGSNAGREPADNPPEYSSTWPVLSVIVIVDEGMIGEMAELLDAVEAQACTHPVETLVLARGRAVADDLAHLRRTATVIAIPERCSPGTARNVGVQIARGDYVVAFDAPAVLSPGAFEALVTAHDAGNAVVMGDVVNQLKSGTGWAAYFRDQCSASFAREQLLRSGGFDERFTDGVETIARDRLARAGQHVAHTSLVTFGFRSALRGSGELLHDGFARGRAMPNARPPAITPPRDRFRTAEETEALRRVRRTVLLTAVAWRTGAGYEKLRRTWNRT